MEINQITDLLQEGIMVVLKVGGPMLLMSMIVGVCISIFQAVTSIQEQTLGFAFKLTTIIVYCFMNGDWMMQSLVEYTEKIFTTLRGGG